MRQTGALQYFMTKLVGLHRRTEINNLDRVFPDDDCTERYKQGDREFYIFRCKSEVMRRYTEGKSLSCFVMDNDPSSVHVAYYDKNDRSCNQLSYVTFTYNTILSTIKESGVHFCKFIPEEKHSFQDRNAINITDNAIMLPYFREQMNHGPRLYQCQYTLIYSDWEVLRIDLHKRKGPATANCKEISEFRNVLRTGM